MTVAVGMVIVPGSAPPLLAVEEVTAFHGLSPTPLSVVVVIVVLLPVYANS